MARRRRLTGMKKPGYLLVIAALVLPLGGVVLDRSTAVSATQIAKPAETRMVRADFDPSHPVDVDYAVPGVLDDRSWKPEYDRMPAIHVASQARRRVTPVQPDEAMLATVADAQPAAMSLLPDESAPATAADDAAVASPQVQS
jgi:hypothetical protein